jgi:type II secretory pathway predicted ATPase ExeA
VMQPMTAEETAAMIAFRLDGWGLENPFAPKAILRIHELSGGVPRDILLLCQQSYDKAQDQGRGLVEMADADSAHRTLQITDPETVAEPTTV